MFFHKLQNSLLTRWIWRVWMHSETGYIMLLPLWQHPGDLWHRSTMKD